MRSCQKILAHLHGQWLGHCTNYHVAVWISRIWGGVIFVRDAECLTLASNDFKCQSRLVMSIDWPTNKDDGLTPNANLSVKKLLVLAFE